MEDNPGEVLLVREAIRRSSIAADVFIAYDGEQALRMLNDSSVKAISSSLILTFQTSMDFRSSNVVAFMRVHQWLF